MKKKFDFKTIIALGICMFSLIAACGATIAWFTSVNINAMNISGSSQGAYFAYGNGKKAYDPNDPTTEEGDRPFGIANTRHLNNLAWLQYTGEFNKDRDGDGIIDHVYFELANDINATGETFTTLPIGTEDNPFIGVFDGNGHTIHNVKITNDEDSFSDMPRSIKEAQAEADQYHEDDAEIVGFFGVVGKLDTNDSYSSEVNSIVDVNFDNITVESKTDNTLIGLAAGFVNAEMSGVKVGTSTISVNGNSAKNNYTDVLSDYGLVGYTTKTAISSGTYTETISDYYDSVTEGPGGGQGWGGSIDMVGLYNSLHSIETNQATFVDQHEMTRRKTGPDTYTDPQDQVIHEDAFLNYKNGDDSYCFSQKYIGATSENVYLTGSQDKRMVTTDETQSEKTLYLNNGSSHVFYLPNFGNANHLLGSVTGNGTTIPADAKWYFDGTMPTDFVSGTSYNIGHVWYEYNGVNHYLAVTSNQISSYYRAYVSTTDTSYTWKITATATGSATKYGEKCFTGYLNTTHKNGTYSLYAPSQMRSGTGSKTILRCFFKASYKIDIDEETGIKDDMYDTCFSHTTGYIVSGADYKGSNYPNGSGNIQVSKYDSSAISNPSNIYTVNANGSSVAVSASMFDDYTATKKKFDDTLKTDSTHYYGLHFMNASVGNGSVFVPSSGLEVPKNCIQFNVANKGLIKFFAGTYSGIGSTSENDCFFSLYRINRNGKNIASLSEIKYIYEKAGEPYYYSDTASAPQGYSLVFNSEWITNPSSLTLNSLYYFEIPVNAGEFALGCVPDHHGGAYLMYLDIGANGATVDTIQGYYVDTFTSILKYPLGIDFAVTYVVNNATNGGVTFTMSITASSNGTVEFSVDGSEISIDATNNSNLDAEINYKGSDTSKYSISIDSGGDYITDITQDFAGTTTRTVYARVATPLGVASMIKIEGTYDGSTFTASHYYLDEVEVDGFDDLPQSFTTEILADINAKGTALVLSRNSGSTYVSSLTLPYTNKQTFVIDILENNVNISITRHGTYTVSINDTDITFTNNVGSYSN